MAPYGDSRRPFNERRTLLLDYIGKLIAFRNRTTYDEFEGDDLHVIGAAKLLELMGELLCPSAGHAPKQMAERFHAARNEIVHEYSRYPVKGLWNLMGELDQLQEEVQARIEPP